MQAKSAFVWGLLAATGIYWGGQTLISQIHTLNNSRYHLLSDGTLVQTIRPEPSEIAESTGLKRWHFRATLPKGSDADMFRYGVEVRKNGVPSPKGGDEFFVPDGRTIDVTVCLSPQNGDWQKSQDIKVWISDNFPQKYEGHTSSTHSLPNPFPAYKNVWGTSDNGDFQKDETFVLAFVDKPWKIGPRTTRYEDEPYPVSIVFKIKAVNQRKALRLIGQPQSPVKPLRPAWEAWFR